MATAIVHALRDVFTVLSFDCSTCQCRLSWFIMIQHDMYIHMYIYIYIYIHIIHIYIYIR